MQKKNFCQHVLFYSASACLIAGFSWRPLDLPAQANEGGVEKIRALIERGNALMNRQQFQPAIDEYQQVLDLEPNNPYAKANLILAHNNWGIFYFHKGELELAKAEWDKALTIDPNDHNAKNNLLVLKRRLAQLGKSLDDLSKEKAAKTAAKAEEKKKEEPPAPSGVVLLTPQKKEDAQPSNQESTGVVLLTPQKKQDAPAGTTETPTDNKTVSPQVKAPEAVSTEAAHGAPVEVARPVETPPPARRTKADDELDAFRRMTSPSGSYNSGSASSTAPPAISTFRPVPRRRVGSPTSFLDDTAAPPVKPVQIESDQPNSPPESNLPPQPQPVTSSSFQTPEETPASEEKAAHKKKHTRQPVADATNPEWAQPSGSPSAVREISGAPGNVDYALNKLETKIYGQPRPQPSVLKRLERMEIDSFGRASVGSITDRIDKLKKLYNITD